MHRRNKNPQSSSSAPYLVFPVLHRLNIIFCRNTISGFYNNFVTKGGWKKTTGGKYNENNIKLFFHFFSNLILLGPKIEID